MNILGYEVMKDRKKDWKYWLDLVLGLPEITRFIVVSEVRKLFYKTPWGICVMHRTWSQYKTSPLFNFRYEQMGINYAVESLSLKEFDFFRRQVYNDEEFMQAVLWHPFQVMDELLDSDTFWKAKWAKALEKQ